MMLALVKCLFWIMKRAAETKLVLVHPFFFSSHSFSAAWGNILFVLAVEKGNPDSNERQWEKQIIHFLYLIGFVFITQCCFVITCVILGNFRLSEYDRWTFSSVEVTFNCANYRHTHMSAPDDWLITCFQSEFSGGWFFIHQLYFGGFRTLSSVFRGFLVTVRPSPESHLVPQQPESPPGRPDVLFTRPDVNQLLDFLCCHTAYLETRPVHILFSPAGGRQEGRRWQTGRMCVSVLLQVCSWELVCRCLCAMLIHTCVSLCLFIRVLTRVTGADSCVRGEVAPSLLRLGVCRGLYQLSKW